MRNRTSKQNGSNNNNIVNSRRIDMEGLDRLKKNEAHLTGAYIRNLVKQLSNSRTKEPMSSKIVDGEERSESLQSIAKCREKIDENRPLQNQPKKQVRRRLHTSRPYQERLLNMAEARREIVTALKFHRASMKQAQEQKKQQEQYRNHILSIDSTERFESKIIPRIEHSNSANFSGYMNLPFQSFSAPITVPNPSSWASSSSPSSIAPVSTIDNLDISLPDQISGFNLNLQSYQSFETMFYNHNSNNNPLTYTSSSTSSTSPFEEIPPLNFSPHINYVSETSSSSSLFHPLMGDEEIAKIKSIGDQHGAEWNDTLNLVNSAWWLKVLKTMEVKHEGRRIEYGDQGFHLNDGMEISDWLLDYSVENPNESCSLKSHLDGGYTEPFLQESSLPCLNMAEIKGKEDEWFSS